MITQPAIAVPLADRLLLAYASTSYCLPALLRVVEVVETEETESACVECALRPRMFINPKFVETHAETPEKLLMLVMHELHHVILGHTRLYARVTPLDNLVFDAVINAMLCWVLPIEEYTALFTGLYRDDRFPECFLRPAPGWRQRQAAPPPQALAAPEMAALAELHRALYSEPGVSYSDLREALRPHVRQLDLLRIPMLGDHREEDQGASSAGALAARCPALAEALRQAAAHWPAIREPGSRLSAAQMLDTRRIARPRPGHRAALIALLRRIGNRHAGGALRDWTEAPLDVLSPLPGRDRRTVVSAALGARSLLYRSELSAPRRVLAGERVHVYVDVSGSIGDLVGPLYAAVLACRDFVDPAVHLFSTTVVDITLRQLREGVCATTGGTSIDCVAAHLREHRIRRAVLITDGYVGLPGAENRGTLQSVRLGVALTPGTATREHLDGLANAWAVLGELK